MGNIYAQSLGMSSISMSKGPQFTNNFMAMALLGLCCPFLYSEIAYTCVHCRNMKICNFLLQKEESCFSGLTLCFPHLHSNSAHKHCQERGSQLKKQIGSSKGDELF